MGAAVITKKGTGAAAFVGAAGGLLAPKQAVLEVLHWEVQPVAD